MSLEGVFSHIRGVARKFTFHGKIIPEEKLLRFKSVTLADQGSRLNNSPRWRNLVERINEKLSMICESVTKQCSAIAVQKVYRSSQLLILYRRLYGEKCFSQFIDAFKKSSLFKHRKNRLYMFGACIFAWEKEKITESDLKSVIEDMANVQYSEEHHNEKKQEDYLASWEEFVIKDHIKIWRRPLEGTNLYEYKVYGTYYDIPPSVFYHVQIDLDYRKKWDNYYVDLNIVDKDPASGCEVVHWVTKMPVTWTPREYLYVRRYKVDREKNAMVMMARAVDHPSCPETNKYVRISQYQSVMVIKPHTTFDQMGFDYVMTYYDDPKIMFSNQALQVAKFMGVNFVDTIYKAAKELYVRTNPNQCVKDKVSKLQLNNESTDLSSAYSAGKQYS